MQYLTVNGVSGLDLGRLAIGQSRKPRGTTIPRKLIGELKFDKQIDSSGASHLYGNCTYLRGKDQLQSGISKRQVREVEVTRGCTTPQKRGSDQP
jgi:hypothetical protein